MSASREVEVGGSEWRLFATRGALHLATRTLLIADLHLGKAAHFRRAGMALPQGITSADLDRLAALVDAAGAQRLLVLGDVVHAGIDEGAPWFARWQRFRRAHPALRLDVVGGNHDRHAELARLGVTDLGDRTTIEGIDCAHHPRHAADAYTIAGHIHPVAWLHDRGLRARLPCFWIGAQTMVLPAFGSFTGGHAFAPQPSDRIFACAGGNLLRLPAAAVLAAGER